MSGAYRGRAARRWHTHLMHPSSMANNALERTLGRKQSRRLRGHLLGPRHLLPDFVIIGAARSGTTHLLGQLNAHPNVLAGPRETHFFDTHRYTYGLSWYRLRFPSNKTPTRGLSRGTASSAHGRVEPVVSVPSQRARPRSRAACPTPSSWSCCVIPLYVRHRTGPGACASAARHAHYVEAVEAEIGPPGDTRGIRIPRGQACRRSIGGTTGFVSAAAGALVHALPA